MLFVMHLRFLSRFLLNVNGADALPPVSEPPMARSVSLPETRSRRPPLPEDAARLLASWRKAGSVEGRFGLRNSVESRAAEGFGGGFGLRGLGGGEVLSRGAFETLLPCIFHANAVHDEVRLGRFGHSRGASFTLSGHLEVLKVPEVPVVEKDGCSCSYSS